MNSIFITGVPAVSTADRSMNNPFTPLLNEFESLGYRFTTEPESHFVLAINHNRKDFLKSKRRHTSRLCSVLITLEPEVVFPSQYNERVTGKYSKVISPGLVTNKLNYPINWPYSYNENPLNPVRSNETLRSKIEKELNRGTFHHSSWLKRDYTCSLIAANKVSNLKTSNYSLRRRIVRYYTQSEVAVFGQLWESSIKARVGYRIQYVKWLVTNRSFPNVFQICKGVLPTRSTGGEVANKHLILANSKFTIVIENSNEVITEKLFDAFLNAAIPIYFGPPLSLVGIPESCVIRVDRIEDILPVCSLLSDSEIRILLENIKNFVSSEYFISGWDSAVVWPSIAEQVHGLFSDNK
jgi:hypothetical protein